MHFHTFSLITLIIGIRVVDNTQIFVHDFNGIFLTSQVNKLLERMNLVDFVVLEPDVDKQVPLKVVGTRIEKPPPKVPLEPLNFTSQESCSPQ